MGFVNKKIVNFKNEIIACRMHVALSCKCLVGPRSLAHCESCLKDP